MKVITVYNWSIAISKIEPEVNELLPAELAVSISLLALRSSKRSYGMVCEASSTSTLTLGKQRYNFNQFCQPTLKVEKTDSKITKLHLSIPKEARFPLTLRSL